MKTMATISLVLCLGIGAPLPIAFAQAPDIASIRNTEAALTFSSGSIQKTSPIDGIVNLITGDNQSTGNRMLLGKRDTLYLKLNNPADVAIGDQFTVYRRVRKVFHPVTREYLGFVMNRTAVVKVTAANHAITTAEVMHSYSPVFPGDPVVRFVAPTQETEVTPAAEVTDLEGMIVELQSDRTMTLLSQSNVVYLDRGKEQGLKAGDLLDIQRHSAGLPPRKIGQLKVLSVEPHTATAKVVKANTRIIKGDRFTLVGYTAPVIQPVRTISELPSAETSQPAPAVPVDLVASKLKTQDASGQSRLNLGELAKFLHYDSGDAAIKTENYTVLDRLIEYLRTSGDSRMVRIEGHTDNVEIGPSLKSRYPSNFELSKVRANGVLRYLVEKGGIDSDRVSSVGYGDTKPTATNGNEEGRTKNRRVEILLYTPDTDTPPPTADVQPQVKHLEIDPASLSARGGTEQPGASTRSTDSIGSSDQGTLSPGSSPQIPVKDGSNTVSNSEASGAPSIETNKQEAPRQPPSAGTPTP